MTMVWEHKRTGRVIYVDDELEERPRPWLSIYPGIGGRIYLAVCWMCITEDGEPIAKECRKRAQVDRFKWAHRRCGFALEPEPDPRAPAAPMDDLVDQLLEEEETADV